MEGRPTGPKGSSNTRVGSTRGDEQTAARKNDVDTKATCMTTNDVHGSIIMHTSNDVEMWLRGQGTSSPSGSGSKTSNNNLAQDASPSRVVEAGFERVPLYSTSTVAAYKRSGGYPLPSMFGYTGENQSMQTRQSSPSQWSVATKSTQSTTPRHCFGSHEHHIQGASQDTIKNSQRRKTAASINSSPSHRRRSSMNIMHVASPVTPRDYAVNEDEEYGWRRKSTDSMQKTAAWVFDPQSSPRDGTSQLHARSSASSDMYKSLVTYLDHRASSQDLRSVSPYTHKTQSALEEISDEEDLGYCSDATISDVQPTKNEEEELDGLQSIVTASIFENGSAELRSKSSSSCDLLMKMKEMTISHDVAANNAEHTIPRLSPFEETKVKGDSKQKDEGREKHTADIFSFPVEANAVQHDENSTGLFGVGSWPTFQLGKDSDVSSHVSYSDDGEDAKPVVGIQENFIHLNSISAWDRDTSLSTHSHDDAKTNEEFEELTLRIVHKKGATGFEYHREIPLHIGSIIAGRYQIIQLLGQAAFSRAVKALDLKTRQLVCLKVVKNSKDYFDQSLDEIKVLRYVNQKDGNDRQNLVRLYDYFYFKEHLILVMELLGSNLYEFSKQDREENGASFFTPSNIKKIASQVLKAVAFMHSICLIHADLKPENIMMKSQQDCKVKVIDLGSSFFNHDVRASFVQSRSYRAPEVILGASYDYKIDIWSVGCILVELVTGDVLFKDYPGPQMLARMESILGKFPAHLVNLGKYSKRYFLNDGRIFEQNSDRSIDILTPKPSNLGFVLDSFDPEMADFVSMLLSLDPRKRPSAEEALRHPWLHDV